MTNDFEHLFHMHTDSSCLLFWGVHSRLLPIKKSSYVIIIDYGRCDCALSHVRDSLQPHGLWPSRLLGPWDFAGKSTGVGSHFLLQGIFLTKWLNLGLLPWQADSLLLSHQGSPLIIRVTCIFWIRVLYQMSFAKISQIVDFLWDSSTVFWRGNVLNPDDIDFYKIRKKWLCTSVLGDGQGSLHAAVHGVTKSWIQLSDWTELNFQNSKRRNWCCFRSLHWRWFVTEARKHSYSIIWNLCYFQVFDNCYFSPWPLSAAAETGQRNSKLLMSKDQPAWALTTSKRWTKKL